METPDIIERKIDRFPIGNVFTYENFNLTVETIDAFTEALIRMVGMSSFFAKKLDK